MRPQKFGATALLLVGGILLGCGSGTPGADGPGGKGANAGKPTTSDGQLVKEEALKAFNAAVDMMKNHDEANDWNDASCETTAKKFIEAEEEQGKFLEAKYNAGVAYQRCKNEAAAKKIFSEILDKDPKFTRARVQLALYKFKESGDKDVEGAIVEMTRAVRDSEYKNIEALVQLSMLQMRRQNDTKDDDGDNDLERAKKNLQRALAINDGFMPAFNQLAIYYLERAKDAAASKDKGKRGKRSGIAAASTTVKRADSAALELAALVCSQAIRKNPNYGPVHNTSGLISAELGDLSAAAQSFGRARQLDPKFYEAHMNYAAVNLQFRGFPQAEAAYRDALKLRDNEYDGHLGLALALRGQINDSNFDKNLKESLEEIEKAKKIDPNRAESYYNEAILIQEFKARGANDKEQEKIMLEAKGVYQTFVQKAGDRAEYKDGVKRAKERMKDIEDIIAFNKQTAEEKKKMEEEAKLRAAQEELKKQQGTQEGAPPPPEGGEPPPANP